MNKFKVKFEKIHYAVKRETREQRKRMKNVPRE